MLETNSKKKMSRILKLIEYYEAIQEHHQSKRKPKDNVEKKQSSSSKFLERVRSFGPKKAAVNLKPEQSNMYRTPSFGTILGVSDEKTQLGF